MGNFSLDLQAFAKQAGEHVELVIKKTALDVFSSLVQKSPVDTGRFRGNWQVGIGAINSNVNSSADFAKQHSLPNAENINKAQAALSKYTNQTIYISNSLPYAQRLEDGYSKLQAPLGMVRLTLIEFDTFIKNNTK